MTADARDPSDAYLAENRLTRAQWEAMVQREVEKQRRKQPKPDLFGA